ncbi:hypothetical protein [uncultured Gemmiger sp.]|uniref:hypothetical protein n=1 Tax=uncultured Gemmiger sp. TaxID=1623490 RepID=UPI0025F14B7F|nr:hypothetical protein [uncultured Gemmiger sp.]
MEPFLFVLLLFFLFVLLMAAIICHIKGKWGIYLTAVTATLSGWFIGLVLDANIDFGPDGFLCLRVLLPVLAMGLCILVTISRDKSDK